MDSHRRPATAILKIPWPSKDRDAVRPLEPDSDVARQPARGVIEQIVSAQDDRPAAGTDLGVQTDRRAVVEVEAETDYLDALLVVVLVYGCHRLKIAQKSGRNDGVRCPVVQLHDEAVTTAHVRARNPVLTGGLK